MDTSNLNAPVRKLSPCLSSASAWALSVGTSIGWGSLVVTSSSYLSQAGPAGSIIGLLLGSVLMLIIGYNFHYLASIYPDAGGIYTYTKNVFGYDRAFIVSWFLSLTYISMFWANATSLPLFARYFLKRLFSFGYLYRVFGYDVYLGEVLLTLAAIWLVTFLCMRHDRIATHSVLVMVIVLTVAILVCFVTALLGFRKTAFSPEPFFVPDRSALKQVLKITFISPWAFIGFENITHSSEEFSFHRSRLYRILFLSVITSTVLYISVTLLSISAYPASCKSWLDYISHLSQFEGIDGLPAFYAAHYYLGNTGVWILMLALLSLVFTSLIGNLRALSLLFYAVAKDDILPAHFAKLNDRNVPQNSMLLVAILSCAIPFLGRTAIGWIVDITTIGATMLYGFVSAGAFKTARGQQNRLVQVTGGVGLLLMLLFGIYLLFPNLFSDDTLETETYILLIIWSIIGLFYFRRIIAKDQARRFGKAIIVWITFLALLVFMGMIWSGRRDESITRQTIYGIQAYFEGRSPLSQSVSPNNFIRNQIDTLHNSNVLNNLIVIFMFILALGAMLINHISMQRWESQTARERDSAREVAYKDPLTGVKSKHAYVESEHQMAEQIYHGNAGPFAVVVCDVNGLKHINDTLGHHAGDVYIKSAADMLCEYYAHSPVYRIGGDEFALILQGEDFDKRHEILKQINQTIEENLGTGNVVASLGMTDFDPETDNTFHSVFTRADGLMYERKLELKQKGAHVRI